MDDGIEIEIKAHDKWKARSDVKRPNWFKCANDLFDDDKLFDLSLEEMAVWIYILGLSSKQQSKRIYISFKKASLRIKPKLFKLTIEKLIAKGIVTYADTSTLRARAVDVTLEERGEEKKRGEGIERVDAPPPQNSFLQGEEFEPIRGLQGNSLLDQVLPEVPKSFQKSWLELYDHAWLKLCLVRAIEHHMGKHGATRPQEVSGWQKKLSAWLNTERAPKHIAKPPPAKIHQPKIPWDPDAKRKALGNVRALDAVAKIIAGSAS